MDQLKLFLPLYSPPSSGITGLGQLGNSLYKCQYFLCFPITTFSQKQAPLKSLPDINSLKNILLSQSHVYQVDLKLDMSLRTTLNFSCSCDYLLNARITDICHYIWFIYCQALNRGLHARQAGALLTELHLQPQFKSFLKKFFISLNQLWVFLS